MAKKTDVRSEKALKQRQEAEKKLVAEVEEDFAARQRERRLAERSWELCMNFVSGNQYCGINAAGDVEEEEKVYGWQPRRVFNHIAPTVELRCAKLARIRPALSVRPVTASEQDKRAASLSSALLGAARENCGLEDALSQATVWSETCGTAFYKVVWDNEAGGVVGVTEDGRAIHEGDVRVIAVPPFEIYPYSLSEDGFEGQPSVIHARAVPVQDIRAAYGVELAGRDINEFALSPCSSSGYIAQSPVRALRRGYEVVIERYCRPTDTMPEGRLTVVAGGKLLFDGPLPYMNGKDGARSYPFIRQTCMPLAGSFFGAGVVERMIPVQRAYNAVRNRKHEFLNRISMGTVAVEEGSVDTDELAEDGLRPGKIIVYRQGGKPPEMLTLGTLPDAFEREEETLEDEFARISGTGDLTQNGDNFSSVTSATGLQLLIEQDDARLNVCYQSIKTALKEAGRQILRLYRQFSGAGRAVRGGAGTTVFRGEDVLCDEVILESDSDLNLTPAERRNVIYEMMDKGLLFGEDGKMSAQTKNRVLTYIGYGCFAGSDLETLQEERAEEENRTMESMPAEVNEYDDDAVHIRRHTAYILSVKPRKDVEERICAHIKEHKNKLKEEANG